MFDDLHFKFTKVAGEEIVAFDFLASVQQHQKIAKAIRQHVHNWLIQALGVVTEPRPFAQAAMRAQNRDKLAEMVSGLGKGTTGSGSKAAWTVELQSSGVARTTPQNLTTTHIESVMNQM